MFSVLTLFVVFHVLPTSVLAANGLHWPCFKQTLAGSKPSSPMLPVITCCFPFSYPFFLCPFCSMSFFCFFFLWTLSIFLFCCLSLLSFFSSLCSSILPFPFLSALSHAPSLRPKPRSHTLSPSRSQLAGSLELRGKTPALAILFQPGTDSGPQRHLGQILLEFRHISAETIVERELKLP